MLKPKTKFYLVLPILLLMFFVGSTKANEYLTDPVECVLRNLVNNSEKNRPNPIVILSRHSRVKSQLMQSNQHSIGTEALVDLNIPSVFHKHFDGEGNFKYVPDQVKSLSLENGDHELATIRMHFNGKVIDAILEPKSISEQQLLELSAILEHLPNTQLLVTYPPTLKERLNQLCKSIPPETMKRIKLVETEVDATIWTQDMSKPINSHQTLLPEPTELNHKSDWDLVQKLKQAKQLEVVETPFTFAGGNMVVGEKHLFLGEEIIAANKKLTGASELEVVTALEREFGKKIVVVKQIDFHIDLTMSVVRDRSSGKEVILMASQKRAIDLLLTPEVKKALGIKGGGTTFEDLLAMHSDKKFSLFDLDKADNELNLLLKNILVNPQTMQAIADRAAALKRQKEIFQQMGYEVRELPDFGMVSASVRSSTMAQSPGVFNYTNSIFSGEHAIIPKTGIELWDNEVERLLKQMGYSVHSVVTPRFSICQMGGIRCLSETYRHTQ